MKKLISSFATLVAAAFGTVSAQIHIDVPVGDDLAAAVATASAQATDEEGVTLTLAKGDYTVSSLITLDKNVSIVGKGREFTRLVSDGTAHGLLKIVHASSVVSDLALVGAKPNAKGVSAALVAGGTLQDALVTDSGVSGYEGGGVSLSEGTVSRVIATGNTALYGGGFYVVAGGAGTMENCLVYGNVASWGGGIYMDSNSKPTIVNCTFEANTATHGSLGGHDFYDYCTGSGVATVINCSVGQRVVNSNASRSVYTTCVNATQLPAYIAAGSGNYRPAEGSILIGAGTTVDYTRDVDGNAYPTDVPSIGAYQVGGVDATRGSVALSAAVCFKGVPITLTVAWPTEGAFASATLIVIAPDATTQTYAVTDGQAVSFTPAMLGNYSIVLEMTDADGNVTIAYRAHNCFAAGIGDVYVDATSATPEAPYDSPEKAATTIETAMATVLDSGTVWIIGDYELPTALEVARSVTIRGYGDTKPVITARETTWCMFIMKNTAATLQSLVIDGEGNVTKVSGRGVLVSGGGKLIDCEIANFTHSSGDGAAINVSTGVLTMDRCVVHDNSGRYGGGVYVYGNASTHVYGRVDCRNSLFYGNKGTWGSAFYNDGPGSLVNCTFFDNPLSNTANGEFCRDYEEFGVTNCVFGTVSWYRGDAKKYRSNNVESSADPGFADRANHDYRPSASATLLHDQGRDDVILADEKDLASNKRIQGDYVDIGAYEYVEGAFSAGFTIVGGVTNVGDKVVLVPTVAGGKNPVNSWRVTNVAGGAPITGTTRGTGEDAAFEVTFEHPGVYTFDYSVVDGENTASVSYANARTVLSSKGGDLYVAVNGASVPPFDTAERATTNLAAALSIANDGATVHIGAGTFLVDARATVNHGAIVEGAGTSNTVITCEAESPHGIIELNHKSAVLRRVTLTGTFSASYADEIGGAIRIVAGTFEDSMVTGVVMRADVNGSSVATKSTYAPAKISRVCVTDCHGGHFGTVYLGGNSYVDDMLVSDSTVVGNPGGGYIPYGGLIYIDAGTVYVTNATLVGTQKNAFYNNGGLTWPRVVNCLFACPAETSVADTGRSTNVFHNCASIYPLPESLDNGNRQVAFEDLDFVDAANGDYHLLKSTPIRGMGKFDPWLRKAKDLDGNKRVSHGAIDPGCYATPGDPMLFILQ